MTEKYLLFDLSDDKSKKLGEIISNPTCKKIVNFLAEKHGSASDISRELGIPLNTLEYNLNKLVESGIIEKTKNYFWSVKGKKIDNYQVANKLIVISPKKNIMKDKLKTILPVILISAIFTFFIKFYSSGAQIVKDRQDYLSEKVLSLPASSAGALPQEVSRFSTIDYFLILIWLGIVLFLVWCFWKRD